VSPNRVRLDPGTSVVITVRLFVSQASPAVGNAQDSPKLDQIILKSLYSEQRIPLSYTVYRKSVGARVASRSPSPAGKRIGDGSTQSASQNALTDHQTEDLQRMQTPSRSPPKESLSPAKLSKSPPRSTRKTSSPPRARPPDDDVVPRAEHNRVLNLLEQERIMFEQKSEKVCPCS
jgi:hypothetical protein